MVTDNFNRADESPLSGNWTVCPGWTYMQIVSNQCKGFSNGSNGAYWNAGTFSNDQFCEITAVTTGCAVNVRQSTSSVTMYHCYIASTTTIDLYKGISGTYTKLGASFPISFVSGKKLKLEVSGTTLSVYYDNVLLGTRTDASIASGRPSIYCYTTAPIIDDFAGGDLGAGTVIPVFMAQYRQRWR